MDRAFPTSNAITKIIDNILEELLSKGISNDIVCLAHTKLELESVSVHKGINYYRADVTEHISLRAKAIPLFKNEKLYALSFKILQITRLTQKIKELYKLNRYDSIISVSWPFLTSMAVVLSGWKGNHIMCQFDPYSQYKNLSYYKRLIKQQIELIVIKKAKKVFLLEPIYKSNEQTRLKCYLEKMEILHCCGLKEKKIRQNHEKEFGDFNNFLYCGYIQEKVRSTTFLFATWNYLSMKHSLYLVGGGDYMVPAGRKNVFCANRVSPEDADSLLLEADFLVNIGNNCDDQIPSKLIDYFSTGKPIICFQKSDLSLEVEYLRKYPLALIIMENEISPQEAAKRIEAFCKRHKGEKIEFKSIEAIFKEFTPQYVAEQIYNVL